MKRYIKNFMMAMMVGATVFGSSCTDSFEEVNTDPDSPPLWYENGGSRIYKING